MGFFLTYVPPPEIVVVNHDYGGYVRLYEEMVARYISEGRRIEIKGMCSSACTLVLTAPGACVTKSGEAAWHHAFDPETNRTMPEVTNRMLEKLPPKLREYLDGKIQREYMPETTLGHDQLVALGVKSCDEPVKKEPAIMTEAFYAGVTRKVNLEPVKTAPAPNKPVVGEPLGGYWPWGNIRYKIKNCVPGSLCANVSYYDKGNKK